MKNEWLNAKINDWRTRTPPDNIEISRLGVIGFITLACVGFLLRIWIGGRGYNFDFLSYISVLDNVDVGGNVYAENLRYNYGPIWFYVLHVIRATAEIFQDPTVSMQLLLSGFLALVDVGIYFILLRTFGIFAAALFILNPVSIIITGYHRQFDNLAILIGMIAVLMIGESFTQPLNRKKVGGLFLLGLSLVTKHLFFAFPLWLAIKQRGWKEKLVTLALPVLIFLLSFVPFWSGGSQGIVDKVFLYEAHPVFQIAPFWRWFVPNIIRFFSSPTIIFFFALIIGAFVFRKEDGFNSLLFYTAILVATSPAIANQYLAIVVPFISVQMNLFYILYTIMATWHLLVDGNGLHLTITGNPFLEELITMSKLIGALTLGLIWKPVWRYFYTVVVEEAGHQFRELSSPSREEGEE